MSNFNLPSPYKMQIAANNRAQLNINKKKTITEQDQKNLSALSEYNAYLQKAQDEATRAAYAKEFFQQPVHSDKQPVQDSLYQKYYSDYMNSDEYNNASYDEKMKYLSEQEGDAKKDKWANILGRLFSAYAAGKTGQNPTKTNQTMAQGFNEQTQATTETISKARQKQNAFSQSKVDLYNEEFVKNNLAAIDNDKELETLVNKAYNLQKEKETSAPRYTIDPSGGFGFVAEAIHDATYKGNSEYDAVYQKILDKGYTREEANNLIDAYTREQNRINAEKQSAKTKEFADKHPVLASAGYVAANAAQIHALRQIADEGITNALSGEYKPMDTNTDAFMFTRYREDVSKTVSENIQQEVQNKTNSTFWANAASFAYQTGLSVGDFLSLSVLPEPLSLAVMGTSTGVATVKSATDRGLSADKALLTGVAACAAEIVFERLSLENLNALKVTGRSGVFNWVSDILKQSFTEGSEEVFTDIANAITDQLINGDMSELSLQYRSYLEQNGGDESAAMKELAKAFGLQIGQSFAGGALSGGLVGTYGSAVGNYRLSNVGKTVLNDTQELNSLINVASAMPENTRSSQLLKDINGKENYSSAKIGELYINTINDVNQSFAEAKSARELSEAYSAVSEGANGSLKVEVARSFQQNAARIQQENAKKGTGSGNNTAAGVNNAVGTDGAVNSAQKSTTGTVDVSKRAAQTSFAIPATDTNTGIKTIITGVRSTKNGEVRFNTASGKVISVNDVAANDQRTQGILLDAVSNSYNGASFGANGASLFIKTALAADLDNRTYGTFNSFAHIAYNLGVTGAPFEKVNSQVPALGRFMSKAIVRQFYDAGVADNKALTNIRENNKQSQKTAKKTVQRTGNGSVTNETGDTSLDEVFKAVAKKLHINIKYTNNGEGNGFFDAASATLTLVKGAKRGDATTLAHEIGEYGRAYNYDAYKQYVDTVIDMLFDMDALSTNNDIMAYHNTYHADEKNTTIQDAKEELVNDVTARLFFAEGGIEEAVKFVQESKNMSVEEKQNFFDTLKNIINHIVDVISKHFTNNGLRSSEKAVGDMSLDDIKALRKQFISVIDGAISNLENGVDINKVSYSFDVTQDDINKYVEQAFSNSNTNDYIKYATVSNKLINELSGEIDLSGYAHALRDNDIRHIKNSHGESTNEKYPVTETDIEMIPYIVQNYDKVFVARRNGKTGIYYIKVMPDNTVYYLEQATNIYGGERLLVNKQMLKVNVEDLPNIKDLKNAIHKKQSDRQFLADLKKIHEVYAQSVNDNHSTNNIPQNAEKINTKKSLDIDEYMAEGNSDIRYSKDVSEETRQFLENQPKEIVYRAMQVIDGKLYPPMAAKVKDESGKNNLVTPSELGVWEQAEERPDLIRNGNKFKLDKANGSSIEAAYNPYFHTSRSPLNDQFSSAYKRPNIVIVEGEIPSSELTSGYKAEFAKDSVGEMKWHSGPVSSKLKGEKARRVILSRWFKPVRIVPDAEVASVVANLLEGENISVPYKVVTPSLRTELEKLGVNVTAEANKKFSLDVDTDGNTLTEAQQEYFKDSKVRDENGKLKVVYHGSPYTFNAFDTRTLGKGDDSYGAGFYFTDNGETANMYRKKNGVSGNRYAVYLNLKNPIHLTGNTQSLRDIKITEEQAYNILKERPLMYDEEESPLGDFFEEYWSNGASDYLVREMARNYTNIGALDEDVYAFRNYPADLHKAIQSTLGYDGVIIDFDKYGEKHYVAWFPEQIKRTDNKAPTNSSDMRFSLDVPVEENKDLIAVHNISEEKLMKSLRLGGLPMPSIAIARAQYGHTNFGDISLVFPKSTIDPEYNNAVWSGDAYTPTYPQIDYKIDRNAVNNIEDKITELLSSKGYTQRDFGYLGLDSDNIRDAIKYGGVAERFKNKAGIMAAYLVDKGIDFTPVMREKSLSETGRFNNKQVIAVANALGEETIMKAVNGPNNELEQYYTEVADALNKQKIDEIKDKVSGEDLEKAKKLRIYNSENVGFAATYDLVRAASEYFEKGITQVISESETKDALKEKIADESDYEKWVDELFSDVVEKEGIRNNRDYYTPSGYPRSFEALHYEHTLENVVRAMKENGRQGIGLLGKNIFGASKVEYNTVAEIKEAADKLIDGNNKEVQDEYEEQRWALRDRFYELASSLPKSTSSEFSSTDAAAEVLTEAVLKYSTKTAMDNYIRRELKGWANYSPTIIDDLMGIVDDIRALPAAYFEAKPQRAVSFNEVYTAIIPDNSSAELKDALKNAGVKYETYKHGDDSARIKALNSLDAVKFSKDVEDDTNISSLIKENEQLKESLEFYKLMSKRNKGHKASRSEIRRIATDLQKSWNSTMTVDEIASELTEMYDYIASGDAVWGTIELMGKTLGKEIVNSAKAEISPENKEVLDDLKTYNISIDEMQRSEIKYLYGDVNTWLNTVRRGVKYSINGTSLDMVWQELSEKYPYLFDPQTTSNDQPRVLYETIQSLNDTVENDYGYDENELAEMIMLDTYDKYFDIPEIVTPLDRADKKLTAQRIESSKRIEEVKAADKARYEKKVAEIKKHYQEMNSRLRERKNQATLDKLAKQKAKYEDKAKRTKDTHERSRLRASIRKQLNKILTLASNPTKEKHLPNSIVEGVKELAEAVTLDGTQYDVRLQEKLNNFRNGFEANKKDGQYYIISELYNNYVSDKIADLNERYGDTALKELPVEALREINDLMKMTAQTINNINRLFKKEQNATIDDYVDNIASELEPMKKERTFNGSGKAFFFNTLKPEYFYQYIGSDTLLEIYHDVRAGEDVWAVDISEAKEFVDKLRKTQGYNDWDFNKVTEFDTLDGKVELTLGEILGLYANTLGEHTRKNLLGGGFVYQAEQRKGIKRLGRERNDNSNHRLSVDNIQEIVNTLTATQQEYVREMIKYLSSTMGAKGNEVSRELYDVELFKEQMYYPALVWDKSHHQSSKEVRADKKIKNAGFTNAIIPEATNPLILKNFDDVWANHVDEMSKYHAFALAMENFDRVYNTYSVNDNKYTSTKEVIENAHGKMATAYIDDLLKDINGGVVKDSADLAGRLVSKFKKNAVFASASVVVQQPSAIGRAVSEIDVKYFVGNPVKGFNRKWYNEMKQYCPVAIIKEFGYFDLNMAQSTVDMLNNKSYDGVAEKVKAFVVDGSYRDDAMSFFAQKADEITWTHIWNACKNETKDKHPEFVRNGDLTEEGMKKAGERFTEVIAKTQVYDSVFSRSGLMRSDNWLNKMATAFMAEPTTSINMLTNAIVQRKRGNIGTGQFARTISSLVIASVLNSLLQSLVTAARHDDKDKDWKEVYLAELLPNFIDNLNPLNQIAFVRDIYNIFKGYDVTRSDMSLFSDLYNAIKGLFNDSTPTYKKITDLVGALGIFVDVPARNILRDVYSAQHVIGDFFDDYQFSLNSATEQFKEEMNSAIGVDIFVTDKDKRFERLYDYQMSGDKEKYKKTYEELKALGLDDDKIDSGIKSALINNDTRVAQGAIAYLDGDMDNYVKYINQITGSGFDEEVAKKAIETYAGWLTKAKEAQIGGDTESYNDYVKKATENGVEKDVVIAAINRIEIEESEESDKAQMLYKWDDIYKAVDKGYTTAYKQMYDNALETKIANGKSEDEAKKEIKDNIARQYKQTYIDNPSQRSSIEMKLNRTGLFSQDDYTKWAAESYDRAHMVTAFESGYDATTKYVNDRIDAKIAAGQTRKTAEKQLRSDIATEYKDMYIEGDADTRAMILTYMQRSGLYGDRADCIKWIEKYWY